MEAPRPRDFAEDRRVAFGVRLGLADLADGAVSEADLLVYDETNGPLAYMISRMRAPVPLGVFKRTELPAYDVGVQEQIDLSKRKKGEGDLMKLIHSGDIWEVEA